MKKKLPIGIDDFCKIRTEGFYYVDKTAMIRDLLNAWGEVNLFTRPRRFGKSLNMSMLKSFLELGCDKSLFEGLEISRETKLCDKYMGKFPVISISLKSVDGADYESARSGMCSEIGREALRFSFLLESDRLTEMDKEMYKKLVNVAPEHLDYFNMSDDVLKGSLSVLSDLLQKHYGKKVIILIDEYDVPLAKANEEKHYPQMVKLVRGIFDQALKSNDSLYFAVLTGCLRVSKESIFTGLNNPQIFSISTVGFDEYFGFTDAEVKAMLEYYGFMDRYELTRDWYDGYRFGNTDVYCPWDVISYCAELRLDPQARPKAYWSNTSGNDAVRHFIEKSNKTANTKREIEALVAGETVEKIIREDLTYHNLYDEIENIWSVLFMTGYLTQRKKPDGKKYELAIPNREIREIFTDQITDMFQKVVKANTSRLTEFGEALKSGDAAKVEKLFTSYLYDSITVRDSNVQNDKKEILYHGEMIGILVNIEGWDSKTNANAGAADQREALWNDRLQPAAERERGGNTRDGYSDVMVKIEEEDIGIIIEFKYARNARFDAECKDAMAQIDRMNYTSELKHEGFHTIYKYGIACFKKRCKVVCEKEEYNQGEAY
ncbi:MAG: ATP-binding protein [Lachnospiraceae bacterium]|nr:ATP-binding protein [Lachnospiraceae bacterium]